MKHREKFVMLIPDHRWVRLGGVMLIALLGVTLVPLGGTIIVDDDGTTPDLQTALDIATAGDRVLVLPGIYPGRLVVPVELELIGSGAGVSILDGEGLGTTLLVTGLASGTVVRGFTITGGSDSGLYFSPSSGIIENNIIEGNTGVDGGGASIRSCNGIFRRNLVRNNSASSGGEVYVESPCTNIWSMGYAAQITNNIIYGNTAIEGGGVMSFRYGYPDLSAITHNTIVGNSATQGGGVYTYSYFAETGYPDAASGWITNNVIVGNSGGGSGDVLRLPPNQPQGFFLLPGNRG